MRVKILNEKDGLYRLMILLSTAVLFEVGGTETSSREMWKGNDQVAANISHRCVRWLFKSATLL